MSYNAYAMEMLAAGIQNDRIAEAKRYSKWAEARKALRELSKNIAKR